MQRYTEIEHTADIGIEVYGDTLEELFQNAGYALFTSIVNVATITPTVVRTVKINGENFEMLLMNWLRELLYLFSVHQEVYAEFIPDSLRNDAFEATLKGEPLDLDKHQFHTEIKAVTYHQFSVIREDGFWKARVIFDV
jgi:SHS2 domain-containing protein